MEHKISKAPFFGPSYSMVVHFVHNYNQLRNTQCFCKLDMFTGLPPLLITSFKLPLPSGYNLLKQC